MSLCRTPRKLVLLRRGPIILNFTVSHRLGDTFIVFLCYGNDEFTSVHLKYSRSCQRTRSCIQRLNKKAQTAKAFGTHFGYFRINQTSDVPRMYSSRFHSIVLRRRDTKESTFLLWDITTENSGLCCYAVRITQNTYVKK